MESLERVLERLHAEVDFAFDFREDGDLRFLVEGDGRAEGGGRGRGGRVPGEEREGAGRGEAVGRWVGVAGWEARGIWGCGGGGGGGVVGAAAEEAVEAAGDQNVPFVVADGGEGGEDVVEGRVVQHVDGGFGVAGGVGEAVEALDG